MPRQLQVIALFLFAPAALGAVECASPRDLRRSVQSCGDNGAYSDAARLCEEGYEAEVKKSQDALTASLVEVARADKQSQSMSNARASYDRAIASLRALVKLGEGLQGRITAYKEEVVFPDDFGAIAGSGFSAKTFLDNNPCYKNTQSLLDVYAALTGSRAKELELTAQIAENLAGKAFRGELKLKPEEIQPMLRSRPTKGDAAAPKSSAHPQSPSDITGTKKRKNP